ncbi:hypothetical protein OIU77_002623 [Salix suchowensis]|uniref:Uncharacterized protein n=1 Tax=Salix suchowensis TaxID=1278906 RepID=A0ABQ9AZS1_9ROSI|nr:hypothetical protein OIU77_002623 [Salix suchowensis]
MKTSRRNTCAVLSGSWPRTYLLRSEFLSFCQSHVAVIFRPIRTIQFKALMVRDLCIIALSTINVCK